MAPPVEQLFDSCRQPTIARIMARCGWIKLSLPRIRFFGRYTIDKGFINNASGAASVPPSGTVSSFPQYFRILGESQNQFLSLGETHIINSQLLNTARISFSRTNFDDDNLYSAAYNALNIPSFVSAGLPMGGIGPGSPYTGMGPNTGYPTVHVQNIYTASDDVFYTHGRHALKFGMLLTGTIRARGTRSSCREQPRFPASRISCRASTPPILRLQTLTIRHPSQSGARLAV